MPMSHSIGRSILLVARGADPVGIGREVEIMALGLRDAGWGVHVACTTVGGSLPARLIAAGLPVHAVGRRPVPDAAANLRLSRLVLGIRPGTVLAWGRPQARMAAVATCLAKGLGHVPRLVCRVAVGPRGPADAWAVTRGDRVVASSHGVATACNRAGVSMRRLVTVEPAAAAAAAEGLSRETIAARLQLDPAARWSLCVAPLVAASRLDRLLWAIDQLGVVHRGLQHVLVGRGPQLHRLLRRARVQHLAERLRIVPACGCLPDLLREVEYVWQSGDVALGGVLFDAMSVGKPAVAVASDAARQAIVDGETGWIVPSLPESEFPRRAFSVIEDQSLAVRFGAAAQARAAAEFCPQRFVTRMLEAIG